MKILIKIIKTKLKMINMKIIVNCNKINLETMKN